MMRYSNNAPKGLHNPARGCGTPLPRVVDARPLRFTPTGLHPSLEAQPRWGRLMLGRGAPRVAPLGRGNPGLGYGIPLGY